MASIFNTPPPFTSSPPKKVDDDSSEEKSTKRCAYDLEELPNETPGVMQRKLKQRQMTMMAVGGTIGTGLFLGMGSSLNDGGPMGLFLGYFIMGTVVWSVQTALGEMVTYLPCSGALTAFPTRFVDPALGFAVCVAGEVTAASIVVEYWKTPLSKGVWITIFFITAGSINFFGVVCYGEMESLFGKFSGTLKRKHLKVEPKFTKNFLLPSIFSSGTENICHSIFAHFKFCVGSRYWGNPGLFRQLDEIPGAVGRFLAFWSVFIQAAYSFLGTETVALAAAEAKNPRKTVPRAITSVFYRAFAIGLVVPFNEPQLLGGTGDASSSPFVIAIKRAHIKVLPDLINAIVLLSAFSATSSQIYSGSRTLHGLVGDGMAPGIFGRVTSSGMPLNAIIATAVPGLLAYMNLSHKSSVVFLWLVNLSAMTGIFTWWSVCLTYIRFHRGLAVQNVDRNTFEYKSSFQPYLSYYGLVMITAIILMNGFKVFLHGNWSWGSFIGAYITLPIFGLSYLFWKIYHKTKLVATNQMNFFPRENDTSQE